MAKKKKPVVNDGARPIFKDTPAKTRDGFRNFAMKLGVASPGDEGNEDNLISAGQFRFNLLTRNRIQLEAAYRGSWIVGRVIDCVAEDMTKAGVIINTNDGAERLQDFKVQMSRLQIWQRFKDTTAWGRLYGGAIGVFQIDGQDLASELDPETIEQGQFRGIAVYDRWQLNPVLSRVIEEGPDIGLPAYYDIVIGNNLNDPAQVPGQGSETVAPNSATNNISQTTGENTVSKMTAQAGGPASYGRVRVHHSRCFRMGGHKLPFFQAITEMMWDESVIERLWDRLIEFETATASAGGLIGRALLRTVRVDGLRDILASGGKAEESLIAQFDYMRMFQQSEGLTILDKEDEFATTAYSFAGLSDMLGQFGEQLSGASETPLVRLFGQSPTGLGSNGETDIRNYYDSINAKQESTLRNPVELMIKILWRSVFGEAAPTDLTFQFTPLWQITAKEKSEINTAYTASVISAEQAGLISVSTAMKELKQQASETGVFTHITDEDIAQAEMEPPPLPEEDPEEPNEPIDPAKQGGGTGEQGNGPSVPNEVVKKMGINKDSIWKRLFKKKAKDQALAVIKPHIEVNINPKPKLRKKTADQKAIEQWIKKK